jgi:hypothetical protein
MEKSPPSLLFELPSASSCHNNALLHLQDISPQAPLHCFAPVSGSTGAL